MKLMINNAMRVIIVHGEWGMGEKKIEGCECVKLRIYNIIFKKM